MGTMTITTTAAQDARILTAVGRRLNLKDAGGLPRDATGAEAKAYVIAQIKSVVFETEQAAARATADTGVTDLGAVT